MSLVGSSSGDVTDVYLSREELVALGRAGDLWKSELATFGGRLAALEQACSDAVQERKWRVWLSGSLCRPVRVPLVASVHLRAERARIVEAVALSDSGLAPPLRCILDEGPGPDMVAIVVEECVLAALERSARRARARIVGIRPWWMEVLAAGMTTRPTLRAVAVWEGHALTLLAGNAGKFSVARTLSPVDLRESAHAALARSLIAGGIARSDTLAYELDWNRTDGCDASAAVNLPFGGWAKVMEPIA